MHTISDYWLTFLIATALPAIVAFVTKRFSSSSLKSVVLAALSAVAGIAESIHANGGSFDLKSVVSTFFVTFITAIAAHYGLLKPVGLTGTDGAIATSVPSGIGSEPVAPVATSAPAAVTTAQSTPTTGPQAPNSSQPGA